jgi:hypothetical protein
MRRLLLALSLFKKIAYFLTVRKSLTADDEKTKICSL